MFGWIAENIATILICLVLILVVAGIIFKLVRNKKKGISSCGCGCKGCSMNGSCHSSRQK